MLTLPRLTVSPDVVSDNVQVVAIVVGIEAVLDIVLSWKERRQLHGTCAVRDQFHRIRRRTFDHAMKQQPAGTDVVGKQATRSD